MDRFKTLFGINSSLVKKTCVIMPILRKDAVEWLGVKDFTRGRLYGAGNTSHFTLIHSGS